MYISELQFYYFKKNIFLQFFDSLLFCFLSVFFLFCLLSFSAYENFIVYLFFSFCFSADLCEVPW